MTTTTPEAPIHGSTTWDTAAHEDLEAVDQAATEQWSREHPDPLSAMRDRLAAAEEALHQRDAQISRLRKAVTWRTVQIPARDEHEGHARARVTIPWVCPVCGGPRGDVERSISFDGSRRLECDGWTNPCGHRDFYAAVRREAEGLTVTVTPRVDQS